MKSTSYKIQIKASVNGKLVSPNSIAWIHGSDSCLAMPCYKENDYFVIELIPDCVGGNCVEGYLTFGSDCDNCEPLYFKRCFCESSADCTKCEECNQYGICQSKCKDGEFCDENGCSECSETVKCPCNKTCKDGKCVCPQNTFEKDGCCIECDANTVLSKCEECVNGVIRQKECAGACDPMTGQCVGCLTGGDCSDRLDGKKCCKDKLCVCCEGTVWDPKLGECVPQYCKSDEECGPCKKCTPEGCKEIECPENHKCVDGECKYWPCTNTSCENGADCGPECGCLNGQCTPCYLLDCGNEAASCQGALGCKCNGAACEPVDNCNEYCDGSTPCTDKNCTCYENNCVSCANFPCTDGSGGCGSYINCGCSDAGECEGNKECTDDLKLTSKTACSGNGCEVTAEFTTQGCKCDPIEFRVKNTHSVNCSSFANASPGTLFNFQISMFKNNHAYKDYKTNPYFGDNELVSGKVRAVITHKYKDSQNTFNPSGVVALPIQNISANQVPSIIIKEENFKRVVDGKGTIVEIKLVAEGISVSNNKCTSYGTSVIKTFVLDFTSSGLTAETCSKINGEYSQEFKNKATDNKSTRTPLFTFLKSTNGEYSSSKFDTSTDVYAKSGWFKKEFGIYQSNKWISTIKTPANADGTTVNQLWSNYNYSVNVDCGCNATSATLEALKFCCPLNISHSITDCNTKITLQSFEVCSVNGNLSTYSNSTYKIPSNSQVNYEIVIVKGKSGETIRKPLTYSGANTIGTFSWTSTDGEPVTSAYVTQVYKGGLLQGEHCAYQLQIPESNLPNPSIVLDCQDNSENAKVTIVQTTGTDPRITNVEFKFGTAPNDSSVLPSALVPANFPSSGNYVATLNKNNVVSKGLRAILTYAGGCKKVYELNSCEASLIVNVQGRSTLSCTNGTGAVVEGEPIGFNGTSGITYTLTGGNLAAPLTNDSGVFSNLPEGDYTMTATQSSTSATNTGKVLGATLPEASMPGTVCPGQTVSLTIKADPGSVFAIINPNGATIATPVIPSSGTYSYPNISTPGSYTVTLTQNSTGNTHCFPFSKVLPLVSGGQALNPQIIFEEGNRCANAPLNFRIFDDGVGATYNVSSSGLSASTAQGVTTGWSGQIIHIVGATSATLSITGVVGDCNTTATPSQTVSLNAVPEISNLTQTCVGSTHTVQATVTNATSVQIGGIAATNVSGNLWQRTGITGLTEVPINAINGGCTSTSSIVLQSCDCPNYTAEIIINLPTCGQGSQDISFLAWNPNLIGWEYSLQKDLGGGVWVNLVGANYSGIMTSAAPNFTVDNQLNVSDSYRVKFLNTSTNCFITTNEVQTEATNVPAITISGPTTGSTGTSYTFNAQGGTPNVTTYTWSGGGVTGNQSVSNPITFTAAGTYTINLQTSTNGCIANTTHTIVISSGTPASCQPPLTVSIAETGATGCKTLTSSATGGSGTITYEWRLGSATGTVLATGQTYTGQGLDPGDTETIFAYATSNSGTCEANASRSFTKCAGACDCVYNLTATEFNGNTLQIPAQGNTTYNFQNYYIEPDTNNGFKVYTKTAKTVTKQCSGESSPTTVENAVEVTNMVQNGFRYEIQGITSSTPVTSVDIINNGTPQTVTVPAGKGNSPLDLSTFLSSDPTGPLLGTQCVFNVSGTSVLQMFVQSTNTGGFNPNGSYSKGTSVTLFSTKLIWTSGTLTHSYSTPCGNITLNRAYFLVNTIGNDGGNWHIKVSYNNVFKDTAVNPTTVTLSQSPNTPTNTKTCSGCN